MSLHSPSFARRKWLIWLLSFLLSRPLMLQATPAFARQMNAQCTACHTQFPILNDFGREFKLGGYTLSSEQTLLPPVAFMVQPGFTQTQAPVAGGAAPGFRENNNFALGQASLFYSGRLLGPYAKPLFGDTVGDFLNHFGVFYQHTYDGVGKTWAWDNAELRYANTTTVMDKAVTYGFYANNNPTMQDPWNTLSAWGFPLWGSPLAPTPAAAPLIDGGLSQQSVGLGGYARLDNHWYVDLAAYHTLGTGFQKFMGVDPSEQTQVPGWAPYWRLAYTSRTETGSPTWEFGTSGLYAETFPGRDGSAGHDRYLDIGLDAQLQASFASEDFLAMVSVTHENQWWDASQALGVAGNLSDTLWRGAASVHLLHDKTYGVEMQYFVIDGTRDLMLYPGSPRGLPLSDGAIFQLNWLPLNKGGGPSFWPRSNVMFTLQYVLYNRFNGGRRNYDGAGSNASGNNTLFAGAWIMF